MALIYKVLRIESQRAFVGRRIFSEGIGMACAAHPRYSLPFPLCSLSEWSEREKRISNGFISTGQELTACLQWSGLDPHCTLKHTTFAFVRYTIGTKLSPRRSNLNIPSSTHNAQKTWQGPPLFAIGYRRTATQYKKKSAAQCHHAAQRVHTRRSCPRHPRHLAAPQINSLRYLLGFLDDPEPPSPRRVPLLLLLLPAPAAPSLSLPLSTTSLRTPTLLLPMLLLPPPPPPEGAAAAEENRRSSDTPSPAPSPR